MRSRALPGIVLLLSLLPATLAAGPSNPTTKPTIADVRAFLDRAEKELLDLANEANRAQWVQSTYITDDTEHHYQES